MTTTRDPGPPADTTVVGDYYRSLNGDVIHLAPCSRMGQAVPWTYADGRSLRSVADEVNAADWMRLCRRCWPAAALTPQQHVGPR